jgi:hypothetical protein
LPARESGMAEGAGWSIFKMVPQRADRFIGSAGPNFRVDP